jgi:hypothetical protein
MFVVLSAAVLPANIAAMAYVFPTVPAAGARVVETLTVVQENAAGVFAVLQTRSATAPPQLVLTAFPPITSFATAAATAARACARPIPRSAGLVLPRVTMAAVATATAARALFVVEGSQELAGEQTVLSARTTISAVVSVAAQAVELAASTGRRAKVRSDHLRRIGVRLTS